MFNPICLISFFIQRQIHQGFHTKCMWAKVHRHWFVFKCQGFLMFYTSIICSILLFTLIPEVHSPMFFRVISSLFFPFFFISTKQVISTDTTAKRYPGESCRFFVFFVLLLNQISLECHLTQPGRF